MDTSHFKNNPASSEEKGGEKNACNATNHSPVILLTLHRTIRKKIAILTLSGSKSVISPNPNEDRKFCPSFLLIFLPLQTWLTCHSIRNGTAGNSGIVALQVNIYWPYLENFWRSSNFLQHITKQNWPMCYADKATFQYALEKWKSSS